MQINRVFLYLMFSILKATELADYFLSAVCMYLGSSELQIIKRIISIE